MSDVVCEFCKTHGNYNFDTFYICEYCGDICANCVEGYAIENIDKIVDVMLPQLNLDEKTTKMRYKSIRLQSAVGNHNPFLDLLNSFTTIPPQACPMCNSSGTHHFPDALLLQHIDNTYDLDTEKIREDLLDENKTIKGARDSILSEMKSSKEV